jgi:hypothetical protein
MKTNPLLIPAIALLALGAPAAAQMSQGTYSGQNGGNGYQNRAGANLSARIAQLQARLQAGVQSGAISRQEAIPLRQQLRQLTRLEGQYSRNGLTGQERAELQQRIRDLRQQLRTADGGAQGRYDPWNQWDQEDRYGQHGPYGQNGEYVDRIDRNNDGFDDRDYDRDGRWDDDVNNGGYQQPARTGGLGGILGNVLGGVGLGGGLRVGQSAPANLYAVPAEYRDQYRDGNGAYYRSDGRSIYQIDARTNVVARVYPLNR